MRCFLGPRGTARERRRTGGGEGQSQSASGRDGFVLFLRACFVRAETLKIEDVATRDAATRDAATRDDATTARTTRRRRRDDGVDATRRARSSAAGTNPPRRRRRSPARWTARAGRENLNPGPRAGVARWRRRDARARAAVGGENDAKTCWTRERGQKRGDSLLASRRRGPCELKRATRCAVARRNSSFFPPGRMLICSTRDTLFRD